MAPRWHSKKNGTFLEPRARLRIAWGLMIEAARREAFDGQSFVLVLLLVAVRHMFRFGDLARRRLLGCCLALAG
jgi:hypothetical protein